MMKMITKARIQIVGLIKEGKMDWNKFIKWAKQNEANNIIINIAICACNNIPLPSKMAEHITPWIEKFNKLEV